jgi:hypothetical protein
MWSLANKYNTIETLILIFWVAYSFIYENKKVFFSISR